MEINERRGASMGNNQPEECEVCCNVFDDKRRPRSLPCGHSFCNHCITNMMQNWHVSCPCCRDRHYVKSSSQFPVNFGLEALIRKLSILPIQLSQYSTSPVSHFGGAKLSAKTQNNKNGIDNREILEREKIENFMQILWAYSGMHDIIEECKSRVLALKNDHKQQLSQLDAVLLPRQECFQDLVQENMAMLVILEERRDCLAALSREGKEKYLDAAATMETLTTATKLEELAKAIVEGDRCVNVKGAWLEECQVVILDNQSANASKKLLARTREALRVTTLTDDIQPVDDSSSITMKDLLEMTEEVQSLLRNDLVFALQQREGKSRFAKISLKENKLYLHRLQDNPPPEDARVLQYSDVYKLVDAASTLAFLDFAWNGINHGRLHVRLHPDTARGRQFALLCTALWGPTYANTRLLAVGNKGSPSEFVRGGDYQYNNGTGGASLLHGLRRGGEYWRQQVSGSVMAAGSWGDACSAQFIISTRNPGLAQRDDTIYGQVEEGLHVLDAAIKDNRISQVNVSDCGIVISL